MAQQPPAAPAVMYIQASPLANPPKDYLCANIMVTIFCCWPVGICAILKSVATRDAINRDDETLAVLHSLDAKKLYMYSLFVGLACNLALFAIMGMYLYFKFLHFDD